MKTIVKPIKNQSGIVSLFVTLIIMIVLTLIVVGFARLSRREQRQILDRQLSAQAFYAAETGVSDAMKEISEDLSAGTTPLEYLEHCSGPSSFIETRGLPFRLSGSEADISYTCLLVDPDPTSLEFGNIDMGSSRVVPVISKNGAQINTISIGWQGKTGGSPDLSGCDNADTATVPDLPVSWPSNCDIGMMRVDLVPVAGNSLTSDGLLDNTSTLFLHPWQGGGSVTEAAFTGATATARNGFGNQGNIVRVDCTASVPNATKECTLQITGLGGLNANAFMLRLKSIYKPSVATIIANQSGPSPIELKSAQATIDSTGKSADVLRRIQVRVPISSTDVTFPEFAIQSIDSICKRFGFAPSTPPLLINQGPSPECEVL